MTAVRRVARESIEKQVSAMTSPGHLTVSISMATEDESIEAADSL